MALAAFPSPFDTLAGNPPAPTIHLGGTGSRALLKQQLGVLTALRAAQQALAEAAPNARDFAPQGPDAFSEAQAAHRAEYEALNCLVARHEAIAEAIFEASPRPAR